MSLSRLDIKEVSLGINQESSVILISLTEYHTKKILAVGGDIKRCDPD